MLFISKILGGFMRWLKTVKVLVQATKDIHAGLEKERSRTDDTPGRVTPDEYLFVVTDTLLEVVPQIIEIYKKK